MPKPPIPSRDVSFAWNVCPFRSVRGTLVVPNGALPKCFFGRASCQKHRGGWKKDLAMIHADEIALLNKKKLYKMFGFFPNPKSLPRKSLHYVQIGASTLLLNCLLYNVYIQFPL